MSTHAGEAASGDAMRRYALLLRGVNVGTKNSLPMAELRSMLTKLGSTDVQTYVQSGNAVFATKLGAVALTEAIEKSLERYMGRPIATTAAPPPRRLLIHGRRGDRGYAVSRVNPRSRSTRRPGTRKERLGAARGGEDRGPGVTGTGARCRPACVDSRSSAGAQRAARTCPHRPTKTGMR